MNDITRKRRVIVLSEWGYPTFLVPVNYTRDEIDREVEKLFGRPPDGDDHRWEAEPILQTEIEDASAQTNTKFLAFCG